MSLKTATAVPFRQRGSERLGEGEFVVVLSLDRGWFSPDQAKRLVDVAVGRGLLERDDEDGDLVPTFDPEDIEIPREFVPDESVLREQSTFEQLLDALVAAGVDKQTAVATVNDRQRRLGVTLETAAVLSARSEGVDADGIADVVRADLTGTEAK